MDIQNLKFVKIKQNDSNKNNEEKPFAVIYSHKLFLGRSLTKIIEKQFASSLFTKSKLESSIKKTFNVDVSIAGNIIKLDFIKQPTVDSYEGVIFESNDGKYAPTWIGNTKMISNIADSMGLNVSNGKFYTSIDYKIENNSIYLEFSKNNYKVSQKTTYIKTGNRIKWDRESEESKLINLFCFVNAKHRMDHTLKQLITEFGFKKQKDYYWTIAELFSKHGDRARGYPIEQIQNSLTKWEYHYIYMFTNGKHGLSNCGKDEQYLTRFINHFSSFNMEDLIRSIKKILESKTLKL